MSVDINKELLEASKNASEKYGIPQGVILAFAGNETSYGTKGMGASKNNVFGIGNKAYASITDSVEDFARLVTGNKESAQSKIYGDATAGATSAEEWVTAITNAGYNSVNSNYISDTMGVYSSHGLGVYDTGGTAAGSTSSGGTSAAAGSDTELKWWGDLVIVILSIILIIMAVVFVGMAVTNNKLTSPTNLIKKAVKK